jgi:hypothetical protein
MPSLNTRMKAEPSLLKTLFFFQRSLEGDGESTSGTNIVGSMNSPLTIMVNSSWVIGRFKIGISLSFAFFRINVTSIFYMQLESCPERGLEVFVSRFPSNYLGVGAGEVGLDHDMIVVWDEEFADVR